MNCLAKNCTKNRHSRGLCEQHYMAAYRLRKSSGITLDPAIQTAVYVKFDSKTCTECGASVHAKGLCGTHYARLLRNGKKQNERI
jgi:hypothetical protein